MRSSQHLAVFLSNRKASAVRTTPTARMHYYGEEVGRTRGWEKKTLYQQKKSFISFSKSWTRSKMPCLPSRAPSRVPASATRPSGTAAM